MSGLDFGKQDGNRLALFFGNKAEVAAQADHGKMVQGLFRRNNVRKLKDGVSTADLILHHCGPVLEDFHPSIFFIRDELRDDTIEVGDDFLFLRPQGVLVRDLEKIGESLGAFSVETADGETDFVGPRDGLADLLAEDETGQV